MLYIFIFFHSFIATSNYRRFIVICCERFEVIMYNQVSRCFKATGSDLSVGTILSGREVLIRRD